MVIATTRFILKRSGALRSPLGGSDHDNSQSMRLAPEMVDRALAASSLIVGGFRYYPRQPSPWGPASVTSPAQSLCIHQRPHRPDWRSRDRRELGQAQALHRLS